MEREIQILMADDDQDDRMLAKEAFEENRLINSLSFVSDGEELIEYLTYSGRYQDAVHLKPDIILLDINMPRKNGIEALKEIKENPSLKSIPVVMLTTSNAEEDVVKSYDLGVSSFITKPVSFDALVKTVAEFSNYWFKIVRLPNSD
jgi:CheY-like chemotaxis protein